MSVALRLGLLGCGTAGRDIAAATDEQHDVVITAVADRDVSRAHAVAEPRRARVVDPATLVNDPDIDIIGIATPHSLLAEYARQSVELGKHVLIEKPGGLSLHELAAVETAARQSGRVVGVLFTLRQDALYQRARQLFRAGAIGELVQARIETTIDKPQAYWGEEGYPSWRSNARQAGGGVLLMNTLHFLDALRYITGSEFATVIAECAATTKGVEVEDIVGAVYRMTSGSLVVASGSSRSAGASDQEGLQLDGTMGRLDVSRGDPNRVRLYLCRPWGGLAAGRWHHLAVNRSSNYRAALIDFLAAVRGESKPAAELRDASAALAAVLAAYRSASSGRRESAAFEPVL